nr:structural maintenance of chromosome protein [Pseudozyma thailandica]
MKQSRSQLKVSERRGLKRSASQVLEQSTPSSSRHNTQTTPGRTNAVNGSPTRSQRATSTEQSTSPAKRTRSAASPAPTPNGAARHRRNASDANGDDDQDEDSVAGEAVAHSDDDEEPDDAADEAIIPADTDGDNLVDREHRTWRSPDKYLPGSIRRIALHNFLTYDDVSFKVGPYLNLICGPNGTGKSSIACAIALGLGGKPDLLGRASHGSSFVKRGETEAWIEIELQGWPASSNTVIRRTLNTENNRSEWFVDGRVKTRGEVLKLVAEFNIDVANLCSFLPQDKVHEFAKMTDAKRLIETERAVGGPQMVRRHERLKDYGKQVAELSTKLQGLNEQKSHLEQLIQAHQVDVERFEERKQIEERIEVLEVMLAMSEYNQTKQNMNEMHQMREQRRAVLAEVHGRSEPLRQKRSELDEKTMKLKLELERLENVFASDEKKRRNLVRAVEEVGTEIEAKLQEVGALAKKDKDRTRRVQELRKEIAERSAELGEQPGVQDTAEIEADMRQVRGKIDDCNARRGDIQRQIQDVNIESQAIDKGTETNRRQLAQLNNVPQQRLEKIRQVDESVYRATMWLRQNQHRFQKQVYEPVILEISLKDQRYAAAVESCIPFTIQKSFVCQTRADYDLFMGEVADTMKLRVTAVENEKTTLATESKPDVPREQLAEYGFDSYIIDLIDGPDDVLMHLCKTCHLHRLPVTLNASVDVQKIERSNKFRRFIAGTENFTINVSRYGNDIRQTVSRRIGQPRSLVNSIDRDRQRQLSSSIQELSAKKKELESQTRNFLQEDKSIQAEIARYDAQLSDLKSQKRDRVGAQRQWERDSAMIEARRRELREKEREPSAEERRARLNKEIRKLASKRSEKMQDLCAQTIQMSKVSDRRHAASLSKWQWDATATQLDNLLRDAKESEKEAASDFEAAVAAHAQARKEAQQTRDRVQRLIDEAGDIVSGIDPNDQELLNFDRVNAELRGERSKLELAEGVRPEVIAQYRARQKQIAKLDEEITQMNELEASMHGKIGRVRAKWEPMLRARVGQISSEFSKAFERMGLVGELRIVENSDFEKWKLEILVKFRNDEAVAPLSAQRQSGGERTLSTIMYIMSLLQLSRSPFTLVDEINQGMDPTAERRTHNHIVGLTCHAGASQYFLITPKLLPDLAVHELQKVLLVNNGSYGEKRFNFQAVHQRKKVAAGLAREEGLETVTRAIEVTAAAAGLPSASQTRRRATVARR